MGAFYDYIDSIQEEIDNCKDYGNQFEITNINYDPNELDVLASELG